MVNCLPLTSSLFQIYFYLLMLVFVLQWLSLHWVISIRFLFQFPLTFCQTQRDVHFHCIAYDYSWTDWDDLHDHLRDVPREDIFKVGASAAASEFCEWVRIDVYIPHCKYQVNPHSSPWFLTACAAAIVHGNHFFHFYKQNKSSEWTKGFIKLRVRHFSETWLLALLVTC